MAPDLEKLKKEFEIDIRSILTSAARVGVSLRDLINEYSQIKDEFGKPNYFITFAGLNIQDHSTCFHELMKFKHVCFFDGNTKRFFPQANDEKTKHLLELVLNTNIRNRNVPRGCFGPSASRASGLLSKDQMESFYAKKDEERRESGRAGQVFNSFKNKDGAFKKADSVSQNTGQNKTQIGRIQRPTVLPNNRIQSFREQNFQQLDELLQGNNTKAPRFLKHDKENQKPTNFGDSKNMQNQHFYQNDFKNPMAAENLKTVFERLGVKQKDSVKPNNYKEPKITRQRLNQQFINQPELLTHEIIQAQVTNLKHDDTTSNSTLTNTSISSKNSRRSTFSGSSRNSNTNYYNSFEKSNFCAVKKRIPIPKKSTISEHETTNFNFEKINGARPMETVNLQKLYEKIETEINENFYSPSETSCRKDFQAGIRNQDFAKLETFKNILDTYSNDPTKKTFAFWKTKYKKNMLDFILSLPGVKLVKPDTVKQLNIAQSLHLYDENNNSNFPIFELSIYEILLIKNHASNSECTSYARPLLEQIFNKYGFGGKTTVNFEAGMKDAKNYLSKLSETEKFTVKTRNKKLKRANACISSIKHAVEKSRKLEFNFYDFEDLDNEFFELKTELKEWGTEDTRSGLINIGDHIIFQKITNEREQTSQRFRGEIKNLLVNEKSGFVIFSVFYLDTGLISTIDTQEFNIWPLPKKFSEQTRRTDKFTLSGVAIKNGVDKEILKKMSKWFDKELWGKLCVFDHRPCEVGCRMYGVEETCSHFMANKDMFLWKLGTNRDSGGGIVNNSSMSVNEEFSIVFEEYVEKID